jgi:Small-conductance mechanosensitive channel
MFDWISEAMTAIGGIGRAGLILLVAWGFRRLTRRLIAHLETRELLPAQFTAAARRIASTTITLVAFLLVLQQLGVSPKVLWTAVTGFLAVAAIAFFAGWSVLSNTFCALLIITTRLFRVNDRVELLENGEKPGLRGQVVDVNLIYTTLQEEGTDGTTLQVPNSLFFQRVVRRWPGQVAPKRDIYTERNTKNTTRAV